MKSFFKRILKKIVKSRTISPYFWSFYAKSQSEDLENNLISKLSKKINIDKSFIEFGFGIFEYNCINLTKNNYAGLLIDGDKETCKLANHIFEVLNLNTSAKNHWIKKDSLGPIADFIKNNQNKLGLLSVDIDGNDYWILKEICCLVKPEIIVTEYNASFLKASITVPYDENFVRHDFHESGFYHGASITAFYNLLKDNYSLVENIRGLNLIFIRNDKLTDDMKLVPIDENYKEHIARNKMSGTKAREQWEMIKDLPFTNV